MWRKMSLLVLTLLALTLVVSAQPVRGVPDTRYARLAKGINLPFWFWYPENLTYANRFTNAEFQALAALGITVVRVPINLPFVHDEGAPNHLNAANVVTLKAQLQRLVDAGLAVIIDIHTLDEANANFSYRLETEPAFKAEFAAFWQSFAGSMAATFSAEDVFFEILNEPIFYDTPNAWPPIMADLAAAIRAGAPDHTIITGAAWWNSWYQLQFLTPLADTNVVYTFHFYEPFVFTHQGATWAGTVYEPLHDIPYPSSPSIIAPLLDSYAGATRNALEDYGDETWNTAKISNLVADIAQWGIDNEVRLFAGEFGVFKTYAPASDRTALIRDVRTAFEANGIPWAMWEYDSTFGLFNRVGGGDPVLNRAVSSALGLNTGAVLSILPYLDQQAAGFNDPADPLGPFKLKNPTNGDGAFCDLTSGYYDGQCAVVLTGAGNQDTKLILTWPGSALKQAGLRKGDSIELRFDWLPASPDADLQVKLVISYSDGRAPTVSKQRLTTLSYDWLFPSALVTAQNRKIISVKAVLRDRTASGTVYIDRMNLFLLQGPLPALPLPPPVQ